MLRTSRQPLFVDRLAIERDWLQWFTSFSECVQLASCRDVALQLLRSACGAPAAVEDFPACAGDFVDWHPSSVGSDCDRCHVGFFLLQRVESGLINQRLSFCAAGAASDVATVHVAIEVFVLPIELD